MGILTTTFFKVIEWLWLSFAIIIIMMLIGMRCVIENLRSKGKRENLYRPNQVYVN